MAKYDEPGFRGATPTGDFDQRSGTAPGSAPTRTPSPDNSVPSASTGIPGVGTVLPLSDQAGTGEGMSPQQPGQNDLGISGAENEPGYVNSGAGDGDNFTDQHRYPWQSKPGG